MKKSAKQEVFIALGVLLIFFLFFVLLRLQRVRPSDYNPTIVGGCKGTRYGCCPNSNTSCGNPKCSNC